MSAETKTRVVGGRAKAQQKRQDLVKQGSQVVQRVCDLVLETHYRDGFISDERPQCLVLLRAVLCLELHRRGFSLPMCALVVRQRKSHTTALGCVRRADGVSDEMGLPIGFNERARTVKELKDLIGRECERAGLNSAARKGKA